MRPDPEFPGNYERLKGMVSVQRSAYSRQLMVCIQIVIP